MRTNSNLLLDGVVNEYMPHADEKSYQNHKDCSVGDTVIATDTSGNEYRGTVFEDIGATVTIQSTDKQALKFRRINGDKKHIAMAFVDLEVTDEMIRSGVNSSGKVINQERSTLSFDKEIVDFEYEEQELVLGDI